MRQWIGWYQPTHSHVTMQQLLISWDHQPRQPSKAAMWTCDLHNMEYATILYDCFFRTMCIWPAHCCCCAEQSN